MSKRMNLLSPNWYLVIDRMCSNQFFFSINGYVSRDTLDVFVVMHTDKLHFLFNVQLRYVSTLNCYSTTRSIKWNLETSPAHGRPTG